MNKNISQRLIDKFSSSRDFTISFFLHAILLALLSSAVLFEVTNEPAEFQAEQGILNTENKIAPPTDKPQKQTSPPAANVLDLPPSSPITTPKDTISSLSPDALKFPLPSSNKISSVAPSSNSLDKLKDATLQKDLFGIPGLTPQKAANLKSFATWKQGTTRNVGGRSTEFEFVAFVGEYSGGNWNSTVQLDRNKEIVNGSLPNLLWIMSRWSKDKIKTNERNVRSIRLDSGELFSAKPPFIFLTGTRDFKLTDKEVENLRKYVMMGGCIWGDSSLPGSNSRFDIAFRREMRRVISDEDKDFKPLPASHPIFTQGYFSEIKGIPAGINYYKEPVYALEMYGQIGILYTSNDYGDMWQIGLKEDGTVDLRRDEHSKYIAINPKIWDYRNTYLGNVNPPSAKRGKPEIASNIEDTYKFGINVVVHLLTRWEDITSRAPSL
ncbi:MAG: DUF4159 domain-containing protein [Chthoniobacterales bacterium]